MEKDRGGKRLRLDAAQRAIISDVVDADRRWLKENYGVDLPALGGAPACSPGQDAQGERMARELLSRTPWTGAGLLWLAQNSPF